AEDGDMVDPKKSYTEEAKTTNIGEKKCLPFCTFPQRKKERHKRKPCNEFEIIIGKTQTQKDAR
ncbi:unnamed protein product, partial [marine sediment metagenome]